MSSTTMRYYKTTLAYFPSRFDRRVRDMNRYIKTQISRRRFKQLLRFVTINLNYR